MQLCELICHLDETGLALALYISLWENNKKEEKFVTLSGARSKWLPNPWRRLAFAGQNEEATDRQMAHPASLQETIRVSTSNWHPRTL